jgi:two-component system chemotaxis response regulator CheB
MNALADTSGLAHPPDPSPPQWLVVVAASAGGIPALIRFLHGVPHDFPGAILIVQHRTPSRQSILDDILRRATPLRVKTVRGGERIVAGVVYVTPADRDAIVTPDAALELLDGRRIKFVRGSANPLLESAAEVFGRCVIAVVLTGSGTDATDGVQAVRARGGTVIAQDEQTSAHFPMPRSAIESRSGDFVLPLDRISERVRAIVEEDLAAREA